MINSKVMKEFIRLAKLKLVGSWVLLGGTLLHYFDKDFRATTDIDIYRKDSSSTNADQLELMNISVKIGIPVESINISAGFFLEKIKDHEKHLVLIEESKNFKLFRPDLILFIKMKLQRFKESDCLDCIEYIKLFPDEFQNQKTEIIASIEAQLSKMNLQQKEYSSKLIQIIKTSD